jgi:dTDP-4-amino-4,6-dideoxygalactose transaminase
MYVPTFQGLGATDFVRPAGNRETAPYPFAAPRQVRFYRARNAIYHLFHTLQANGRRLTALVPDYNSGNEVLAMRAAGVKMHFYPVGPDGQIDVGVVDERCDRHKPDVLYVIHYLGWPQPMQELAELSRRREMLLVEDCALALLSGAGDRPLGSFGDWSVYCLYKTLPVPNGAILVQNSKPVDALEALPLHRASVASDAGRTAELVVQRIRSRANGVGKALQTVKRSLGRAAGALEVSRAKVGDIGFTQSDVDLAISPVSNHLLRRLDFESIRNRRVRNFRYLATAINGDASVLHRDLADGVCPLFFPLLVPDKRAAAEKLRQRGIERSNSGMRAQTIRIGTQRRRPGFCERTFSVCRSTRICPHHIWTTSSITSRSST